MCYMKDMIVKSTIKEEREFHLQIIFDQVRRYNMRLNLEKCNFGVRAMNSEVLFSQYFNTTYLRVNFTYRK